MTNKEILCHVDHTLLTPTASWADIHRLCEEALCYGTASACIPPSFVSRARSAFPTLRLCTVIGFPLGYDAASTKRAAAEKALENGADELDAVINLGDVKNGEFSRVTREISALSRISGTHTLKIIIETCFLTEEEKITLCHCVTEGGADFIKTSTGFGSGGATREDAMLLLSHVGGDVRVKASGGIRTREDMEMYISLGCRRLGTSKAVELLTNTERA